MKITADAIQRLMNGVNVVMNRPAVEAGLSVLAAGGDFADGIIAYEGDWLVQKNLSHLIRRLPPYCSPTVLVLACFRNGNGNLPAWISLLNTSRSSG